MKNNVTITCDRITVNGTAYTWPGFDRTYGERFSWEAAEKAAGRRLDWNNYGDYAVYICCLAEHVREEVLR